VSHMGQHTMIKIQRFPNLLSTPTLRALLPKYFNRACTAGPIWSPGPGHETMVVLFKLESSNSRATFAIVSRHGDATASCSRFP